MDQFLDYRIITDKMTRMITDIVIEEYDNTMDDDELFEIFEEHGLDIMLPTPDNFTKRIIDGFVELTIILESMNKPLRRSLVAYLKNAVEHYYRNAKIINIGGRHLHHWRWDYFQAFPKGLKKDAFVEKIEFYFPDGRF